MGDKVTMNKYNEIEIQTAKALLEHGYKWIAREKDCKIWAYKNKPHRDKDQLYCAWDYNGDYFQICTKHVPIFLNVTCADKEPVSLESIVHPQILDDVERKYLSAFIKPFRDRVKHICRVWYITSSSEYQRIYITLSDDSYNIDLPLFKKETMYKGMKIGKAYTLEELGL
ncbi:hypothetical protein [Anaerolactibacter massiliensis]|uniref:hypothetical protein n=1 Tax=Anaerolactibacter massiliensis TaxID=2044573 RepID=UPI000CF85676|nr:hypothetical protein [Anaerolactibacter massiliensis]